MSEATEACGCRVREDDDGIQFINPCRMHKIDMHVLSGLHKFGGHEECCDVPAVKYAMEKIGFTLEEMQAAADQLDRRYAQELLRRPEFVEEEAE